MVQSVYYVRVMRAQVLSIRERDYVRAARAIGLPRWRIITWHVVPNGIGPIIVQMSLNIGVAILLISALSFIGLGAPPPTPEWGAMIASGLKVTVTGEWWVWAFPAQCCSQRSLPSTSWETVSATSWIRRPDEQPGSGRSSACAICEWTSITAAGPGCPSPDSIWTSPGGRWSASSERPAQGRA